MLFEALGLICLDAIGKGINTMTGKKDCDKYGMYKDGNGNCRLRKNNHWVVDTYNNKGEKIIKNVRNGKTEINIDELESSKRKEAAIKSGNNFYLFRSENSSPYKTKRYGNKNIIGDRYKDVNDKHIYVIREINYINTDLKSSAPIKHYIGEFYMNMAYEICFPTKQTLEKDLKLYGKKCDDIHNFIIKSANNNILALKEKFNSYSYLDSKNIIKIYGSDKDINDVIAVSNRKWRQSGRR